MLLLLQQLGSTSQTWLRPPSQCPLTSPKRLMGVTWRNCPLKVTHHGWGCPSRLWALPSRLPGLSDCRHEGTNKGWSGSLVPHFWSSSCPHPIKPISVRQKTPLLQINSTDRAATSWTSCVWGPQASGVQGICMTQVHSPEVLGLWGPVYACGCPCISGQTPSTHSP